MRVFEERGVKKEDDTSNEQINLLYFLFWTSTYELLCVVLFFWVDFLPWYGDANLSNFGTKYVYFNSKKKKIRTKTGTLRAGGLCLPTTLLRVVKSKSRTSLEISERSRPKQEKPPARRLPNTLKDTQRLISKETGLGAALVGVYENEFGFIKRATVKSFV